MSIILDGTNGITSVSGSASLAVAGPAFSAYLNSAQTVTSSVYTKVTINAKEFDTNTNFDATTNYRFQPTVAGYYQINGCVGVGTAVTQLNVGIFKNGAVYKQTALVSSFSSLLLNVSSIVYFNGSADYVELYVYAVGTTPVLGASSNQTYFNGVLIRSA